MTSIKKLQVTAQLIVFALLSPAAFAVDGVLEINQTCATQLGCFSNDAVGYPVTIDGSAGRSYRLTSDLIVPDASTHGIEVMTSDISIDLNGFKIVPSGCVGGLTDCTPTGTEYGAGVYAALQYFGISVKNGSISGLGYGVRLLAKQCVVTGLRARWNRVNGIRVGSYSIVNDSVAYANGEDGIYTSTAAVISGNVAIANGFNGIYAGLGSTVIANSALDNGQQGDSLNGSGIETASGANVQQNTVRGNKGYGLFLTSTAGYRDNVITLNTTGTIFGSPVNLGGNLCNTDTTCP